ncbi:MAG: hypothetical protein UY24_C0002G0014 [Parcubacteria group bacterium GW2011_GWA1_48_11b]|uniref:Uncharacterized protein n=2 Tax=Parcubacteria group TaxID=1794811 RepID=A0A0G1U3G6_9BACT|nr:MAG: hypothetical protein UY02_C0003G0014 [Candidatus Giovannonibacteria bacterium GW2011_GWB1_47_6b]KKU88589.1 MAG: hypothetical protein UY19_C0027G0004 [Candidatus Wolfebacteria bacterium GW2011_GWA2_47_9b]KKU95200.1 MAG: hypothetical protein UY24_C0002G0014 [Parcubacteria group bacterium GW2011_GWA1_48_11b]
MIEIKKELKNEGVGDEDIEEGLEEEEGKELSEDEESSDDEEEEKSC